ncbi:mitochondrial ribosomal subunit S27-domain-containing protein [Kalaharituber pfeilii]|nr:mitochondrial ribosomal subunit S27-domain-containing protein [Kalaharituber pfeilii]
MSLLPSRERLLQLAKVSCRLFNTTFNPTGVRTGTKILRQRLRGPVVRDYYPKQLVSIKDLKRVFPDRTFIDEDEVVRLEDVQVAKIRGKGAPKKQRTKVEGRRRK